ncbi:CLUMA_CG014367, isoform A [Clunio marinus]|uniref:CLUMA_CG014367, isoform A n=1 Tax=Clunio marinus TaxID=568069 RepID=A0A1J1IMI3_9DIPT|nr:CLUMA_CG014367, isoform A [Clunio marinus]
MFKIFLYCFIHSIIGQSLAQYPLPENGDCDDLCKSSLSVNAKDVLGIWYVAKGTHLFVTSRCIRLNITNIDDNRNLLEKTETIISTGKTIKTEAIMHFFGNGTYVNSYTELEIPMRFEIFHVSDQSLALVLCRECGFFSKNGSGIFLEILTRLPYPKCELVDEMYSTMSGCGVPEDAMVRVDQSDCNNSCS